MVVMMTWGLRFGWAGYLGVLVCALAMGMTAAAMGQTGAEENAPPTTAKDGTAADQTASDKTASDKAATDKDKDKEKEDKDKDGGLVIEPTELPGTYPQGVYQVNFEGRGNYVPVLHWRVESGALPPGITLEDNGVLHGAAERAGEFQFVVSARRRETAAGGAEGIHDQGGGGDHGGVEGSGARDGEPDRRQRGSVELDGGRRGFDV